MKLENQLQRLRVSLHCCCEYLCGVAVRPGPVYLVLTAR